MKRIIARLYITVMTILILFGLILLLNEIRVSRNEYINQSIKISEDTQKMIEENWFKFKNFQNQELSNSIKDFMNKNSNIHSIIIYSKDKGLIKFNSKYNDRAFLLNSLIPNDPLWNLRPEYSFNWWDKFNNNIISTPINISENGYGFDLIYNVLSTEQVAKVLRDAIIIILIFIFLTIIVILIFSRWKNKFSIAEFDDKAFERQNSPGIDIEKEKSPVIDDEFEDEIEFDDLNEDSIENILEESDNYLDGISNVKGSVSNSDDDFSFDMDTDDSLDDFSLDMDKTNDSSDDFSLDMDEETEDALDDFSLDMDEADDSVDDFSLDMDEADDSGDDFSLDMEEESEDALDDFSLDMGEETEDALDDFSLDMDEETEDALDDFSLDMEEESEDALDDFSLDMDEESEDALDDFSLDMDEETEDALDDFSLDMDEETEDALDDFSLDMDEETETLGDLDESLDDLDLDNNADTSYDLDDFALDEGTNDQGYNLDSFSLDDEITNESFEDIDMTPEIIEAANDINDLPDMDIEDEILNEALVSYTVKASEELGPDLSSMLEKASIIKSDVTIAVIDSDSSSNVQKEIIGKYSDSTSGIYNLSNDKIVITFKDSSSSSSKIIKKIIEESLSNKLDICVGLSSMSRRNVGENRLLAEALKALEKAQELGKNIMAFKPDTKKYNDFIKNS